MTTSGDDVSRDLTARALLDAGLGLRLQAGEAGLDRPLRVAQPARPAREARDGEVGPPDAIVLLGAEDLEWLAVRSDDEQRAALAARLDPAPPAVVVCGGIFPPAALIELAEQRSIPVFLNRRPAGQVGPAVQDWLTEALVPRVQVHGVLVQVHTLGVMLIGESGIGKSESALELVLRGHRLVADDVVELQRAGPVLLGQGAEALRHYLEVRGLGVLHAADLFGQAAVLEKTAVHLVVELVEWGAADVDRTGLDDLRWRSLGVSVPMVRLPVRPGRNLALLIEVAARNQILKRRGIHSAQRFAEALEARLADPPTGGDPSAD